MSSTSSRFTLRSARRAAREPAVTAVPVNKPSSMTAMPPFPPPSGSTRARIFLTAALAGAADQATEKSNLGSSAISSTLNSTVEVKATWPVPSAEALNLCPSGSSNRCTTSRFPLLTRTLSCQSLSREDIVTVRSTPLWYARAAKLERLSRPTTVSWVLRKPPLELRCWISHLAAGRASARCPPSLLAPEDRMARRA